MRKYSLLIAIILVLSLIISGCGDTATRPVAEYSMNELTEMWKKQDAFLKEFDKKYSGKDLAITGMVYDIQELDGQDKSVILLAGTSRLKSSESTLWARYLVDKKKLTELDVAIGDYLRVTEKYRFYYDPSYGCIDNFIELVFDGNYIVNVDEFYYKGKSKFSAKPIKRIEKVNSSTHPYDLHVMSEIKKTNLLDACQRLTKKELELSGFLYIRGTRFIENVECRNISVFGFSNDTMQMLRAEAFVTQENLVRLGLLNEKPYPDVVIKGVVDRVVDVPSKNGRKDYRDIYILIGPLDYPEQIKLKDVANIKRMKPYASKTLK